MITVHWTLLFIMLFIGMGVTIVVMALMMTASDADDLHEDIYRRETGVDLYD